LKWPRDRPAPLAGLTNTSLRNSEIGRSDLPAGVRQVLGLAARKPYRAVHSGW
jgi:hypothetical protein